MVDVGKTTPLGIYKVTATYGNPNTGREETQSVNGTADIVVAFLRALADRVDSQLRAASVEPEPPPKPF